MDAEKMNAVLSGVSDFGGIFDESQLDDVKIMSLPVMLVINSTEHWIGIFIDKETIEVMDSIGLVSIKNLNPKLCRFLCAHMKGKTFIASPKLQADDSEECGKYVISFLIFKALTQKPLSYFLSIFSKNLAENSKIISKIFKTIINLYSKF